MKNESKTTTPHMAAGARYVTPLRYPGGKARLGPWLAQLMRHNRISGGWYVEPYAGGAGAALFLLTRGYVDHIVINDLDPVVHAFWWAVLNDTEALLALLADTPVTLESWERQRSIHASPDAHSLTQLGFATFFLNRTNRSGILTGGVIGGRDQTGPYMLDARFNKDELALRIRRIASLRRHISLYQEDALDLIDGIEAELPARSLTYFDPPYYHKANRLYRNHYKPDDHARIAEVVVQIRTPWLVTYDNCTEIREIYKGVSSTEFSLHYSTSKQRPRATEVMFYGNLELQAEPSLMKGG